RTGLRIDCADFITVDSQTRSPPPQSLFLSVCSCSRYPSIPTTMFILSSDATGGFFSRRGAEDAEKEKGISCPPLRCSAHSARSFGEQGKEGDIINRINKIRK